MPSYVYIIASLKRIFSALAVTAAIIAMVLAPPTLSTAYPFKRSVSNRATHTLAALRYVRLSRQAKQTRLVFTLSNEFRFHSVALSHPKRLLIIVDNAVQRTPLSIPSLNKTPIYRIRTANAYKKITKRKRLRQLRIVLDLKKAVDVRLFRLAPRGAYGHRLVVDISTPAYHAKAAPRKTIIKTITKVSLAAPLTLAPVVTAKDLHKQEVITVVIDPGHGGKDPGATGAQGTEEKAVVLAVAKRLQRIINQQPGFHAVLTRNNDYFLGLRKRLLIARQYKADIFLAIHADAYFHRHAHGASVYALSRRGATSEAARWLAEKENHSEFMGGASLANTSDMLRSVLISLQETATIRSSLQMGQHILTSLKKETILHHNKVEQAAFVVLKSLDIPSLLIELGFLSNPHEEIKLRNSYYQETIARAIMRGIKSYLMEFKTYGV